MLALHPGKPRRRISPLGIGGIDGLGVRRARTPRLDDRADGLPSCAASFEVIARGGKIEIPELAGSPYVLAEQPFFNGCLALGGGVLILRRF
jgi:hypothetical protein